MHRDVQAELGRVPKMTEAEAAKLLRRFRLAIKAAEAGEGATSPATGYHDARDSVREAAVRGQGTRTDRAYRRGLRGRGQR